MDFKGLMNQFKDGVNKHSPEILIGIGIAGMISTTVLAVKVTPRALKLIEEAKKAEEKEKLEPVEVVKTVWKPYVPSLVTGCLSIGCIIGGTYVNGKRNVALATAYKLAETTLADYREKVIETIGENKEKQIREKVDKKRIEQKPASKADIVVTGNGETLCFDINTGQYFKSNVDRIRGTVNELNRRMLSEMYISWNEFLYEIGEKMIPNGDDLGWNINTEGFIDLEFGTQLTDENAPCITMSYLVAPRYDYSKLM